MLNLLHGRCVRQTLWEGGREGQGRRGEGRGDGPEGEHIPLLQKYEGVVNKWCSVAPVMPKTVK